MLIIFSADGIDMQQIKPDIGCNIDIRSNSVFSYCIQVCMFADTDRRGIFLPQHSKTDPRVKVIKNRQSLDVHVSAKRIRHSQTLFCSTNKPPQQRSNPGTNTRCDSRLFERKPRIPL